jgi:hypothetical protein
MSPRWGLKIVNLIDSISISPLAGLKHGIIAEWVKPFFEL